MKIHTDATVNIPMLYRFAEVAGATVESISEAVSRTHARAFTVYLSGNSRRSAMGKDYKAATWDQWGVFLGQIFDQDEEAKTDRYANREEFNFITFKRFDGEDDRKSVPLDHDHRWEYAGIPFNQSCKNCDARQQWRVDDES